LSEVFSGLFARYEAGPNVCLPTFIGADGVGEYLFTLRCNYFLNAKLSGYAARKPKMTKLVVLVVEDEPIIRLHAAMTIEDAGYDVLEAANADEAIALLESRPDIRVVFSDIEMPGSMDGLRLIHAVRHRWPPVLLVLTSGRVSPTADELPENTVFLHKPYLPRDLLRAMAA